MENSRRRIIIQGEDYYCKLAQKRGRQPLSDESGPGHLSPNTNDKVQGFDRIQSYLSLPKPISHAEMPETPDHSLQF